MLTGPEAHDSVAIVRLDVAFTNARRPRGLAAFVWSEAFYSSDEVARHNNSDPKFFSQAPRGQLIGCRWMVLDDAAATSVAILLGRALLGGAASFTLFCT